MENSTIVLLVFIMLGIAAVPVMLRGKSKKPNKKVASKNKKNPSSQKRTSTPRNKYRAVSIKSDEDACASVKAIGAKRFLVEENETPELPLADCDAPHCTCRYVHHEDRRDPGNDRRALGGTLQTQLYEHGEDSEERRKKRGRRATDWE